MSEQVTEFNTVKDAAQFFLTLYNDQTGSWRDYPIYVRCDDGVTRKVSINGACAVPHGHKYKDFVYDGGVYLKAEL
jgi:hypothetical protein